MVNPITVSATRFRLALMASLLLSVVAIVGVIVYGIQYLNNYADEVNQVAVEASNSESKIAIIQKEAANLEANQMVAEKARAIIAESKSYEYQDVIIRDLEEFAREAKINVQSYDFTSGQLAATKPTGKAAANAKKPAATTAGPKSTTVNISLVNPVDYRGLLRFINLIEQNLTRMQIANITMSGMTDDRNNVTSGNFIIQVYIR